MRTRVIVVEDDAIMREHLTQLINNLPGYTVVHCAATFAKGAQLIDKADFDLALIDLALPDGNGLSLIKKVAQFDDKKSIVISVFGDQQTVLDATAAGVDGYLLKDGNLEQISDAVQQVMAGFTPISPAVATHLMRQLRNKSQNSKNVTELTPREHEVLSLIARGYTFKEVAQHCGISLNTVSFHTKQIYDKLSVHSRSAAIYKALNSGILGMDAMEAHEDD